MIRQIPCVTNIYVKPKPEDADLERDGMRIAKETPVRLHHRRKFIRPSKNIIYQQDATSEKYNKEDQAVYTDSKTTKTPAGITTRYQNINYREGDK